MKKRLLSLLLAMLVLLTVIPVIIFAQESNEQKIYKYLTGTMGLNRAAACGVLSNLEAESTFNPAASGDSGTSYGICQWHNERWTNLKNYCNATGYNWQTLEGQLHFLEYELTLSYPGVLSKLRNAENSASGTYQAAYNWCYYYEIPANKETVAQSRGTRAQNYYWPKYGGTGSSSYYISYCTPYPSSCKITLISDTTLYAQPTDNTSYSHSVATLGKGTVLSCPRIWKNNSGEFWYEVIYDGAPAYLSSSYANVSSYLCSAAISDPSIPTIHQAGKSFILSGLITADWGGLSEVSAKVLTSSGSTQMSQSVSLSQNHYQLKGSTIDDNMTFGKLAVGNYTYVVTATIRHYFYNGSSLSSVSRSHELVHADFAVRATVPPMGDINGDGSVNNTDLTLATRHVAQIAPITDLAGLLNADVNRDGTIDSVDLTRLARYISGKISSL